MSVEKITARAAIGVVAVVVLAMSPERPVMGQWERRAVERDERVGRDAPVARARGGAPVAKLARVSPPDAKTSIVRIADVRGIVVPSPHVAPSSEAHTRPSQEEGYCGLGWGPHLQVSGPALGDEQPGGIIRVPLVGSASLRVTSVPYGAGVQVSGRLVRERRDHLCTSAGPGALCKRGRVVCHYIEATRLTVLDCDGDYS